MSTPALGGKALDLAGNISRSIKGDPPALQHVIVALLARVHVLLDGTYPLLAAKLDRFLMKIYLGYPNCDAKDDILRDQVLSNPLDHLEAVLSSDDILAVQRIVRDITKRAQLRYPRRYSEFIPGHS